ncbi:16S rRNA (cytidine(1402)-2'-O)-methyltransferase [Candidatus Dojkabacteria bacterium]|jgi:16S rRNA (cytidine1402-2'-O)-methyltransferase|nr:16S rRNA (cytidine(1402)-2'-O)-methyltransferase [Candidatus Dojkabacteria bacterium]
MKGKLFVVATPIGNLSDMSFRAIETLKKVAFVLAEDTRTSKVLLNKYEIITQLVSYRDQNHSSILKKIIEKLDLGLDLALISDAGTPLISDPGYKLVENLKENGYTVIPIPGPDAVTCALSASGLPTDRYIFLGFLPKSDKKRIEMIERYGNIGATVCIYESPNRLMPLLNEINSTLGERKVCVANDMTKLFEDITTGKVSKVIEIYLKKTKIVGEFVVLIGKE